MFNDVNIDRFIQILLILIDFLFQVRFYFGEMQADPEIKDPNDRIPTTVRQFIFSHENQQISLAKF